MNSSKTLLLTLLTCFFAFQSYAQTSLEGDYYSSQVGVKKAFIKQKKGNYIQVVWLSAKGNNRISHTYKPIDNSKKIFEKKLSDGRYSRLDASPKDYIRILYLNRSRKVLQAHVFVVKRKLKHRRKFFKKEQIWKGQTIILNATSTFHQKNSNKIVFFSEKPVVGKEDFSKMKTSFKVGEAVWAVAYLSKPLEKYKLYINGQNELTFAIGTTEDADGSEMKKWGGFIQRSLPISVQELTKNYVVFQVCPASLRAEMNVKTAMSITNAVQNLGATDHLIKVKFEVMGKNYNDVYGAFTLDCSEHLTQAKKNASAFKKAYLDSKKLPQPMMTNAALEQKIVEAIQRFGTAAGWDTQFTRAIITSPTWQTVTDPTTGAIKGRMIEAACVGKWSNGDCGYQYFTFIQEHQGGGMYAEGLRRYSTGYRVPIGCNNIK
ncbi:MAG TPA: hypothetical protein DCS93_10225 [Microscillaceae bacterium]|nr:hypothetical protein [Microscillaceae bacterium]